MSPLKCPSTVNPIPAGGGQKGPHLKFYQNNLKLGRAEGPSRFIIEYNLVLHIFWKNWVIFSHQ